MRGHNRSGCYSLKKRMAYAEWLKVNPNATQEQKNGFRIIRKIQKVKCLLAIFTLLYMPTKMYIESLLFSIALQA